MDIYEIRKANLIALIGNRVKRECADKWEMAPAHLSQVLSDKTKKNLGDDVARRIEDREGLPRGWLDTLRGDDAAPPRTEPNIEPGPDIKGRVPLISWVQAGAWCEVEDLYAVGDAEEWMPCPTSHGPRTYALRVRGESMFNPHERRSFRDGDIIFVDPDRLAENGSPVIAKLDDSQEATFKQLVIEGEERYLKALNPNWPDRIIRINGNATICGVVIGKYEVF